MKRPNTGQNRVAPQSGLVVKGDIVQYDKPGCTGSKSLSGLMFAQFDHGSLLGSSLTRPLIPLFIRFPT